MQTHTGAMELTEIPLTDHPPLVIHTGGVNGTTTKMASLINYISIHFRHTPMYLQKLTFVSFPPHFFLEMFKHSKHYFVSDSNPSFIILVCQLKNAFTTV